MRALIRTATLLLLSVMALGCGDDDTQSASDFTACGGNPEGKWSLVDLKFDDPSKLFNGDLFDQKECKGAARNVSTDSSGSYTFNGDKTYSIDIEYSVSAHVVLSNSCLQASSKIDASNSICQMLQDSFKGAAGFTDSSCTFANAGCDCAIKSPSVPIMTTSTWSVKGDQLVLGDRETPFCIEGGRFELMAATDSSSTGITGLITLQR